MRDLPQEYRLAMNERFQSAPWVWLLEVEVPSDPVEFIRICNSTSSVDFDSDDSGSVRTYLPTRFSFGEIRVDTEGSLPNLPLSISNVTREYVAILIENGFLVGQPVRLILVNTGTLDDPEAKIEFQLEIRLATAKGRAITFNLSSYSLNAVTCPVRRLGRTICDHGYGNALCGFDIDTLDPGLTILGLCVKTETACGDRGDLEVAAGQPRRHPRRIGLFKGLPLAGK